MQHPKQSHLDAALRVVRYIKGSPGLGIFPKRGPISHLSAFCDSDWAACPKTHRSITGYIMKLGDSLLYWKSKKQQTVSCSSAEAEYKRLAAVATKITWLVGLLQELNIVVHQPVDFYSRLKFVVSNQVDVGPKFGEANALDENIGPKAKLRKSLRIKKPNTLLKDFV
ncbi:uncharacterized mitochondrial protein AtMg00810-like [Nicotiana sylvestris]|uniref:uncharacterized mitochondrial protein AtMg00810-like n=1 Tax=Nicotiana sylvestris TaxID=4096 RepID=UPI00388C6DD4